jgi:hypothetical protein
VKLRLGMRGATAGGEGGFIKLQIGPDRAAMTQGRDGRERRGRGFPVGCISQMMCRNMACRHRHSPNSSDTDIPSSGLDKEPANITALLNEAASAQMENRARALVSGLVRGRIWRRTKLADGGSQTSEPPPRGLLGAHAIGF